MMTLQEIKDEILDEVRDSEYSESHYNDEVAKRYAIEVAKEALRLASVNAHTIDVKYSNDVEVDIQSILSETNIPKLK